MPDIPYLKFHPPRLKRPVEPLQDQPLYAELHTSSNFSFLRGASHPEELITQAASLGYRALAITDRSTLAGIVRAHTAARDLPIQFIVGCCLSISWQERLTSTPYVFQVLVYPTTRAAYGRLCALLSLRNQRISTETSVLAAVQSTEELTLPEFIASHQDLAAVLVPPSPRDRPNHQEDMAFMTFALEMRDRYLQRELLSVALSRDYSHRAKHHSHAITLLAEHTGLPIVATGNVFYHSPERRPLQDVLTCIRNKTTIRQAGFALLQNAERYLKRPQEIARLFSDQPRALTRSLEIAELCQSFSLDQLRYEYPQEVCPEERSPIEHLSELTYQGAKRRFPNGLPPRVAESLSAELSLIQELGYEKYFLTCHDIVNFARSRGILCQGRGAAANSAVCFCLGITSVDPSRIDLLFARFVSRERNEPPDIDIDFEHERREEVIQYLYSKFGRHRAGLTCEVITYRYRSAVRDVGKALGLPQGIVDKLAKSIHRWTSQKIDPADLQAIGLRPDDTTVQNVFLIAQQLLGFPRHLSQHVGGFIISEQPLSETVPIRKASMEARTIIEWDKDDIDSLGMLKIDVLALGMLTCIRKALELINQRLLHLRDPRYPLELHSIPAEDPAVYDMICRADTIGVFQIESRAQMSMLPRLKPRCFYDLVIEVAIVRPGPIQGNMVHPYLKRRSGKEPVHFPDERVASVLGKTLGVPIFQEQAMRLAIMLARFTPGEAEQLRRAMAAWKRDKGVIATFQQRIIEGMISNGYSLEFAQSCVNQIKGFSEYGFPESHAASFALLVYASAWIKHYFPAEFAAALLNSQPMGFYSPSQIIADAQAHSVAVCPIDVNHSSWNSTIEGTPEAPALRLGMHLVKGFNAAQASRIYEAARSYGAFSSMPDLWRKTHALREAHAGTTEPSQQITKSALELLAQADAFRSLNLSPRYALWEIKALPDELAALDSAQALKSEQGAPVQLPLLSRQTHMFQDYRATGLSLKAHPIEFVRSYLTRRGALSARALRQRPRSEDSCVGVGGIAVVRQRPGTAKGVVFITLEDETGMANLIIRPHVFERFQRIIIMSATLLAFGKLDRVGEVLYISAEHLESLDSLALQEEAPLPNKSYSY